MPKHDTKQVWTVLSMLEWATDFFQKRSVPSPRLSIEWLLADLLQTNRLNLYLLHDRPLSDHELKQLRATVRRRAEHEPLQYITGYSTFLDCRINVDSSVLIPRQETEQMVVTILEESSSREKEALIIADIGTGSGCIPIAIQSKRPHWSCLGIDISIDALSRAKQNAQQNQVTIEWIQGDLNELAIDSTMLPCLDLIISNPPYILPEEEATLESEVIHYEPRRALIHPDPLQLYRAICDIAMARLNPSGILWLECNSRLTGEIFTMMRERFAEVEIRKDLDNNDRYVKAKKASEV